MVSLQVTVTLKRTDGRPAGNCNIVETCCQEVMWQININIKNVLKV